MAIDMLDFGAEVCSNTGLSHRSLSKHEKNSPPSDQKRSGGELFF
ncbi:Transposase for IS660 [Bacillus thuringiensis serovar andalousiensis BGSC 4AW1]|nr:Transposase for IS660 [Bacillus thuringiensis serovar andalousiensis BGSC 4AW1]